jgi:hypothetical protein
MKTRCKHDWPKWGEPYFVDAEWGGKLLKKEYQRRACNKCGLIEKNFIGDYYAFECR